MSLPSKTIHMIAPVSAIHCRTRLVKQAYVMQQNGIALQFFGWERQAGEAGKAGDRNTDVVEKIILRGGGYGSRLTHLFYMLWMTRVFFKALKLPKGANVLCLGFETAFPVVLVSRFRRINVVFDDADRFSMILSLPGPLNRLMQGLEKWTSSHSAVHLIPGWTRYDWKASSMKLLRNSPNLADFESAKKLANKRADGAPFTLYANGWIGETRGAPIFLALMERLAGDDFLLKLIGRGDGDAYAKLVELPNVEAQPEVPQSEALAAYLEVDLALTYYDPKVPINRQAESNKWGDCVYLNVPFIVNSEVETAFDLVESGAAFAVPYDDVDALEVLVRSVAEQPEKLLQYRQKIGALKEQFVPYDEAFEKILFSGQGAFIDAVNLTRK